MPLPHNVPSVILCHRAIPRPCVWGFDLRKKRVFDLSANGTNEIQEKNIMEEDENIRWLWFCYGESNDWLSLCDSY
jgi:hypothetical protein